MKGKYLVWVGGFVLFLCILFILVKPIRTPILSWAEQNGWVREECEQVQTVGDIGGMIPLEVKCYFRIDAFGTYVHFAK